MKGGHGPTKQVSESNWDTFNHVSHASELCHTTITLVADDMTIFTMLVDIDIKFWQYSTLTINCAALVEGTYITTTYFMEIKCIGIHR